MKKTILLFLLISINIYSQEYIIPSLKTSFALNNHTNRDITYFTTIDSNENVISIGTTERDSTLTDILTTKLDPDLNRLWQRRFSFDTDLSYDYPLQYFIDAEDNIYIVCFSATTQFVPNAILNIIKYDTNGNELWHIDFNDFNNSDYIDYRYRNAFMDSDGFLHVVQVLDNETFTTERFDFYKINSNGVIVDSFSREDVIDLYSSGFIDISFEVFYKNNNYYVRYRRGSLDTSSISHEHFIKKINSSSMVTYPINDFIDTNDTAFFTQGTIEVDSNDNMYLLYPLTSVNRFKLLKLDSSGNLAYYIESPDGYDKDIFNIDINSNNNLSVICNSKTSNSSDNKTLNQLEYDDNGNVINDLTVSSTFIDGLKYYSESSILVYTNGNFKLFDEVFNLVNDFVGSYNNFDDFNLINNSNVVIGRTTLAKMYPTSDFFSQQNIEIQKIDNTQVLNTYNFSGEGTSKAFRQKVIIDNNDNYIVASEEKLGPDNFAFGGSKGPLRNTLYKYNSNLELIWSLDIDNAMVNAYSSLDKNFLIDNDNNIYINSMLDVDNFELIKVSPDGNILYQVPSIRSANIYFDHQNNINVVSPPITNGTTYDDDTLIYTIDANNGDLLDTQLLVGLDYLDTFRDSFNDSYIYMYSGETSPKLNIYRNLSLEFETNIAFDSSNDGILSYTVDDNGDFIFSSAWAQINAKLHKITLNNTYSYIDVGIPIRLVTTVNNKSFTYNNDGFFNVYDNNLNLVSSSSVAYNDQPRLLKYSNHILSNTPFNNLVKVFDDTATEVDEFKLPGLLTFQYTGIDSENNLILTGEFGDEVPNFLQFAWARGFLHKYESSLFTLSTDDYPLLSENDLNVYPNPTHTFINVESSASTVSKVELFDLNGRFLFESENSSINISHLASAFYVLRISLANGNITNRKIIKQ